MRNYSDEFKASIIARLMPPNNEYVPDVAKETGIPKDTLYAWRIKYGRGNQSHETGKAGSRSLTSEQQFDIVLETASMNEAELSEYCRRNGLYPEQIKAWSEACRTANAPTGRTKDRETKRQLNKEVKQLKAELRRKEKALADYLYKGRGGALSHGEFLILEALLNLCNPDIHKKFNLGDALHVLDQSNMLALLNAIVRTYTGK